MEPNLTLMKKVNDAFSATRNVTNAVVIALLFALVTFSANTQAQNIVTTLGTVSTCPGQDVLVPVNVQNFTNVASASLQFTYDTTVMSPVLNAQNTITYLNLNPNVNGIFLANDDAGTVTIGFFIISGSITIGSGLLVNLKFHMHNHSGYTNLVWNPNPNLNNYSDPNFTILPATFTDGNVHTSPSISQQPLPLTLAPGATGSITLTGVETISYQWQLSVNSGTSYSNLNNNATYSNVTTNTLTISNALLGMNNYKYRCVLGGNCPIPYNFTNSNAVNLTVSVPCPTAYLVSGGGTVCTTGPGAAISLANSQLGVFYQLKNGTIAIGSPITGTGSGISFPAQTAVGTYSVVGTNDCGSTTMTGTVSIVNVSPPTASISGTPQVCAGVTAQLNVNLTGSKPLSLVYSDGTNQFTINGITQNFYPLQVTPIVTTTYTLVSVSNVYCSGTVSGSGVVTVKPAPQITVANNGPLCPGATLNLTANGGISYQWAGPNSFFTTNQNPTILNVSALNSGTYAITVTGSNSCTATGSTEVVINPSTPSAAGTISGPATACQGTTGLVFSVAPISGATSYIWSLPSGVTLTSGGNTNSITVSVTNSAITGIVSVHGENNCGVGAASNHALTISSIPIASASAINSPVCAGLTLNLQANGGSIYNWAGPNGFASTQQNPSIINVTTAASGSYSVTVSNSGGCSAVASFSATVNPVPTASAGSNSPICAGQALNLTSGAASTYSWSGPNGFTSTSQNPTIPAAQISATGNYSLTITNGSGCQATTSISVTVRALPIAGASNTGPVCAGSPLELHATGGSTYSWSGPIGFSNGTQNPIISSPIVANSGTYTVTVTGSNGCSATATTAVTINARPTANAGTDQNTIIGNSVTLNGSASGGSGVYSYSWSPAASLVNANVQNPTTIALPFTTTFSLVVTDLSSACQSAADQVVVNVSSTPLTVNASVLPSNIICQGSQVQLTANAQGGSGNYTYVWGSTPGGFTSGIFNPTATPSVTTVYSVTVSDGISSTSGSVTVTVNPLPSVYGVGGGGGYCQGTAGVNVTLSGSQFDYQYSLFLNGIYQSQKSGTGLPLSFGPLTEPGSYTISALSPASCQSAMTGTAQISVNQNPIVNAGVDQTINVGSVTTLSGLVLGTGSFVYSWTPAALVVNPSNATTLTHSLTSTTVFTLNVTNQATACSGSDQLTVNVTNVPLAVQASGNPLTICQGAQVTLSASATGGTGVYTFTWNTIDGFSASGPVVTDNPTSSKTYTVVVSDGLTNASTTVNITVNPLPIVFNVIGGGNSCAGNGVAVSLDGSQSGVHYQLFLNGNPLSNIINGNGSSISFGTQALAGTYTAVATNNTTLCTSTMDFEAFVQVFNNPTAHAGPDQNIQYNTSTTLSGSATGKSGDSYTYHWEPASKLVNPNIQNPTTTALLASTTFTLVVTNTTSGCVSQSDAVVVNVSTALITVNATATPQVICAGASIQLNATVSGGTGSYTYSWTASNGYTSSILNPIVNPSSSLTYHLVVSDGITSSSSDVAVTVNPLPTAFAVSGGGTGCSGSSQFMVNLSGSEVGVSYAMYINGTYFGFVGDGTGSAISFGPYSTSGEYTIIGHSNGCQNWMSGNAHIEIITTPVIIVNPSDINVNEGGSGSFQVISTSDCTYQWLVSSNDGISWSDITDGGFYSGSTTSVLDVTGAILEMNGYLYHCILSNSGCSVSTTDAQLNVSVAGQDIITSIDNSGFCAGPISVPVNVQNLFNVASISLTLQYNSSVLQYTGFSNVNPGLNDQFLLTINATSSLIQISHFSLTPSNIGNGVLLDLNFNYLGGTSNLNWDLSVAENCQYTDIDALTIAASFINGGVHTNGAIAPVVSLNPLNSTVLSGNPASFTISASGASSYQWQVSSNGTLWTNLSNGLTYNGVTTSTLNIPSTTVGMNGMKYHCVVSEPVCGLSATSNFATLTITVITNDIITTIGSTQACAGNAISVPFAGQNLENVAAISLTLLYDPSVLEYTGYQNVNPIFNASDINIFSIPGNWRFSWFSLTPINMASGNFADISFNYLGGSSNLTWDVTTPGACEYNDYDGNPLSAVFSNGAITPSGAMPQINSQPLSIVVADGQNGTFAISAANAGTYQWQFSADGGNWSNLNNGGVYSGTSTAVLTLTGVNYGINGYFYRCVVTSGSCTAVSDAATLTVTPFVTDIVTSIGNSTACSGDQIVVPVNGQYLQNVAAISLTLNYNPAVLTYENYQNLNSAFSPSEININSTPGQWFFSWFSLTPINLNSADIIDLVFTYNGGTTNLTWDLTTPGFCEYDDFDGNSLPAIYNNGIATSNGLLAEITGQPVNLTVNDGDNANFSLIANNASAYQWQISTNGGGSWNNISNGGMYSGATSSNLVLTAVNFTLNSYKYRCLVTGDVCVVTSNAATLSVYSAGSVILTTAANATECPGNTVVVPVNGQYLYNVAAISLTLNYNPGVLSYEGYQNLNSAFNPSEININAIPGQWFFSWFSLTPVNLNSADIIDLVFTYNGGTSNLTWDVTTPGFCEYNDFDGNSLASAYNNGTVTSSGAVAEITAQPVNQAVNDGSNANFSITANNASTYQWQISTNGGVSWTNIIDGGMYSGATTSNLVLTAVNYTLNTNQYRCLVTGDVCVEISNSALLTVYTAGSVVLTTASNVTECAGNTVVIPVNGQYLYDVAAISLTLLYDPAVLTYNNILNLNSAFNMAEVNIFSLPGDLRFSWFSLTPVNLFNENLFDIDFTFNGGYTNLTWDVATSGNCEYTDYNGNSLLANYTNGSVSSAGISPTFNSQPSSVAVNHHDNATFDVVVSGAVSYQWQVSMNGGLNWTDLSENSVYSGVTSDELLITNAIYLYNGNQYRCVVAGEYCTLNSSAATLTVIAPEQFTIITTAGSENSCPGSDIVIPINVTDFYNVASISLSLDYDASVLDYTGYSNLNPGLADGLVSPTVGQFLFSWYSLTPLSLGDGKIVDLMFHYNGGISDLTWDIVTPGYCEYTDFDANTMSASFVNGTVSSSAVQAVLNSNPLDVTAYASESATFSVDATNVTSYQWQVSNDGGSSWSNVIDGATYNGASTSALTIPYLVYELNNNLYHCVVSGTCGLNSTSTAASLTVIIQPTIIITAGTVVNCANSITIPVTAENFDNVAAMSLTLNYDNSVLNYEGYENLNAGFASGFISINSIGGQIKAGMFTIAPISIGNGLLFDLNFSSTGGSSALTWDVTVPGNCMIQNINLFVLTTTFVDGTATVNPLPIVTLGQTISTCIDSEPFALNGLPEGGAYSGVGVEGNMFYPSSNGAGTFVVTYTFTDGNGCTNSASQEITVNPLPEVSFGMVNSICLNAETINLSGTPEGGLFSGNGVENNTFNASNAGTGIHTITYFYTDGNGCSNTATQEINVLPVPSILSNPVSLSVDEGGNATFSVIAENAGLYQWQVSSDGGANWADVANNAVYSGVSTTELVISGASYDMNGNQYHCTASGDCSPSVTSEAAVLTVYPVLTITAGSVTQCAGNFVIPVTAEHFYSIASMSLTLNYDNTVLTYTGYQNVNPVLNTGVIVISELDGQVKAGAFSITPLNLGDGLLVEYLFSSTGGSTSLTWDLTTPGNCEFANFDEHLLTVHYNNGSVVVNALPTVTLDPSTAACIDASPVILNGMPEGGSYSGTGLEGNLFFPAIAGVGVHTISYTYTDNNGCVNSTTQEITVNALPEINFGPIAAVCFNSNAVELSATPEGGIFTGTAVEGNLFDPAVAGAGTYTISYTYTDGNGCTNSASQEITVNTLPVVTLNELGSICINANPIALTGLPEGGSYSGIGVEGNMFYPAVAGAGTYSITYTYTNENGCTASSSQAVTVNALPEVTLGQLGAVCISAFPIVLNGTPTGGVYSGTGVDGDIFYPSVAGAGAFSITYTYSDVNGCTNSSIQEITVNALPEVVFNALSPICLNAEPLLLNATPAGGVYTGTGIIENTFNPSVSGLGTFSLTYTYTDGNGCINSASQDITVNEVSQLVAIGSSVICAGETADITVEFIGGVAPWTFVYNGNTITTSANPYIFSVSPTISTIYDFTSVSDANMCTSNIQTSVNITVLPITSILSSPSSVTVDETGNTSFSVEAQNATGYQWQVSTNGGNDWADISEIGIYSGTNTATLTLAGVTLAMNGYEYQCIVSGTCPTTTISGSATLTVNPIIKTIAGNAVSCAGNVVIPITVEHMYGVASMSLSLNYDNSVLNYVGYQNVNSELLNGFYQIDAYNSQIKAGFFSVIPANIGDGLLFDIVFSSTGGFSNLTWDLVEVGNCEYQNLDGNNITSVYINGDVLIHALPVVTLAPVAPLCINSSSIVLNGLPAGGVYSGTSIDGDVFYPTIAGAGVFAITYTYTDNYGCVNSTIQEITVNALPEINFGAIAAVCFNSNSVELNATPQGGIFTGTAVEGNMFDPATAGPGTYTITYTYTDGNSCTNSTTQEITVNALPVVTLSEPGSMCISANPIALTGLPEGGSYSGVGVAGNMFYPSVAGAGTFTITYTYTDENACTVSTSQPVTVNDLPVVSLDQLGAVCNNASPIALNGTPAGGVYSGTSVEGNVFYPTIAGTGVFAITYTYTDGNGCINSTMQEIIVNALPEINFGAIAAVCFNSNSVELNAAPQGGIFTGTAVEGNMFNPAVAGPGTYTITYTYTDGNGCTNSASQEITVNALPVVTLSEPGNICVSANALTLYGSPVGGSYSGVGVEGNMFYPAVAGPGTYTISYTYTNENGCTSSTSQPVTVNALPVVTLGELGAVCNNASPISLYGTPAGGVYSGSGVIGNVFNPELTEVGVHTITYTFTDEFGCANFATQEITTLEATFVSIGNLGGICQNADVFALTQGQPAGGTYSGTGVVGNTFNPAEAGVGTHLITYTYTNTYGCTTSATTTIVVNPLSNPIIVPVSPVCYNAPAVTLVGLPAGGTFSGTGVVGNTFDPATVATGTYTITYTFTNEFGCISSTSLNVDVVKPLQFTVIGGGAFCAGGSGFVVALASSEIGMQYHLYRNGIATGVVVSGTGSVISFGTQIVAGTYTVVGVNSVTACSVPMFGSAEIIVNPAPNVYTGGYSIICQGTSTTLNANVVGGTGPYNYQWIPATNLSNATIANPIANPASTAFYTVIVTDANGCTDSDNALVVVNQAANVNAGPDKTITLGLSTTLNSYVTGGHAPYTYSWTPAIGLNNANILSPLASPLSTTVYTLAVTDSYGCVATDQVTVNVTNTVFGYDIFGQVTYDNTLSSPLSNTTVLLKSANITVATGLTDFNGNYTLPQVPNGNYTTEGSSTKLWGGVNSLDALKIARHFQNLEILAGLRLRVGDVDGNGVVNANDALLVMQRSVHMITTFPINADWAFEIKNILINNAAVPNSFKGLCYGDVNGSYIPPVKAAPSVALDNSGTQFVNSFNEFTLPIKAGKTMQLGAASLAINFPANSIEILDVIANTGSKGNLVYNISDGVLYIEWYSLSPVSINTNDDLFTLKIRSSSLSATENLSFEITGGSELGNEESVVIDNAVLTMPKVKVSKTEFNLSNNYPNPFSASTTISYTLPENGNVTLKLYNHIGEEVAELVNAQQTAGRYNLVIDGSKLPQGVYIYKIEVLGETKTVVQSKRMIVTH